MTNKFFIMLGLFSLIVLNQNCDQTGLRSKTSLPLGQTDTPSEGDDRVSDTPIENTPISNTPLGESVPAPIKGNTYYVATTGVDDQTLGRGSSSKPFKTISYAIGKMNTGDRTFVRSGVYPKSIRFGKSGVSVFNAIGELPVIDCENRKEHGVVILEKDSAYNPIKDITIEGFEIRNCWHGISLTNGLNTVIRRNKIHHNRAQGILGNGKNVVIDSNHIYHNGNFAKCAELAWTCNQMHGIYGIGSNWRVTNNLIYDNLSYGIHVAGYPKCWEKCVVGGYTLKNTCTDDSYCGANGWLIANNTVSYNNYGSAIVLFMPLTTNSKIINNIMYENGQKGPSSGTNGVDFFSSPGAGHEFRNNLCYATSPGGTACYRAKGIKEGNFNVLGPIITADPNFVTAGPTAPQGPNFRLKANSPAVNKGLTINSLLFDILGMSRTRGGAFDIGAYEY